jgi:hypothetical protein
MTEVIKSTRYNPVNYLKKHLSPILPDLSHIDNISFPGYEKRAFHSIDRPSGLIEIDYTTKEQERKKFFVFLKHHRNACEIHNSMSHIYQKLEESGEERHMPRPYLCDETYDANYMEYVKGTDLKYTTFLYLSLSRRIKLKKIFHDIGKWLHAFHQAVPTGNSVKFSEIQSSIEKNLERSSFFNETEKQQIRHKISDKINTVPDTFSLVTPHNDFALRNIIHVKPEHFVVIDWDAMYHTKFPSEAPIWNDITTLIINVLSLSRFSPVVTRKEVQQLADSFLNGYFEMIKDNSDRSGIMDSLYIFTLCYYLGIIGDRPFPEIYTGKLQSIFLERLKKNLLLGKVY